MTLDPETILEACINETIWRDYKIESKLSKIDYCKRYDDKVVLDISDYIVATVYVLLALLNIIGSFYDVILCEKDQKTGKAFF